MWGVNRNTGVQAREPEPDFRLAVNRNTVLHISVENGKYTRYN